MRLVQGDFDAETVYDDDPFEAASAWVQAGARYLHVVDLDGARLGSPQNLHHLERIAGELGVPVQCGGGLRSVAAVRDAFAAGAARVILGTAAFSDIDFLDEVVAEFADRTVVSIDTRGGFVSTPGWTETTTLPAAAAIERLQDRGVRDVRLHERRQGRHARRARPRRGAQDRLGRARALHVLRRDRQARGSRRARRVAPGQPHRRDRGKALYERRFTVAEGQAALDGL